MATHPLAQRCGQPQPERPATYLYAVLAPTLVADEIEATGVWEAVQAVRPDTPHVSALRFLNVTGKLLGAVLLVASTLAVHVPLRPF